MTTKWSEWRRPRRTGLLLLRRWWARYLAAVTIVALATVVQALVLPRPSTGPFVLFYSAVALTAWLAGFGPSLAAVCLAALAGGYLFLEPLGPLSAGKGQVLDTILFTISASIIGALVAALRAAVRSLAARSRSEARVTAATRREAEAEIRHAAELLELGDAFVELDRDWRIVRVNANGERLSRKPRAESLGRVLWELWPSTARPDSRYWREGHRCMEERVAVQFEEHFAPLDMWTAVTAYPTSTGGIAVFLRDVSDRKRAEQAVQDANARLRDIDRRKNEFLAVLSHELRNPLAPIRNSVYVMERATPGGEQAHRALRVIDRQVEHLARLIDDLLDLTRISRGKVRLQRETIDLNELVRGTSDDLRGLFEGAGIDLHVSLPEQRLRIDGDPTRIAQVLGNLLQNAAKFTPAGGRAELELRADEHSLAVIELRDDGPGISPELLEHVFEPFVQAEKTLARDRGGLGLGLALVKGLVELHGGTASASSEGPGRGSLFTIRLPLVEPARPRLTLVPPVQGRPRVQHVLVIEDNVDAATSLKEALELSGHVVDVALTGPEGIRRARATVPDVILCDIGLPEVDGYAVAEALRADPDLRSIYLVALSGYALPEDVERSREAGFDRHVAKPPDLATLEQVLACAERPPEEVTARDRSGGA